ncbi:DoxX-like family protein, partial [Pseudacidovorax intermedius]|uniref:DoxX-like family protein n=1 Tax=Pseudacidovorax intermedius TaxID=433924 RepID=UPI0005BD4A91
WTFAVSIGLYPREQSLALLHAVGVSPGLAWMMLPLAAVSDLLLGLATLALEARSRARWVWPLQLGLMGLYTLVLTLQLPEFWLHPFGSLSKNLPLVALIAWLWSVDAAASARPGRPKEPR